jgi:carbon-monoxide dehydrogenase medium subunit
MLHQFNYLAPRTRAELHGVLAAEGPAACLLAGGTDLLVNIRAGFMKPRVVVDAKKVEGFSGLSWSEREGLVIRAGVTINQILRDARTSIDFPLLVACGRDLASHQLRNRATVVGNIVNASPGADMTPALLCLRAHVTISSKRGEREVPLKAFFKGVKRTVLARDEVVDRIVVPAASKGARGDYFKLKRINGHDLGIVGVALCVDRDGELRVGVSACAPVPLLIEGLDADAPADEVVAAVMAAINPITDVRASKEYRRHMVEYFVRRLLDEVRS